MRNVVTFIIFSIIPLLVFAGYRGGNDSYDVNRELALLDKELARRSVYLEQRQNIIDSLSVIAGDTTQTPVDRLNALLVLGDRFNSFETDSALMIYDIGRKISLRIGNDTLARRFMLRHATFLPISGYTERAIADYNSVDTTGMSRPLLEDYYDAGRQMYYYIALFHQSNADDYKKFMSLSRSSQKKLIPVLDHNTAKYKLNLGEDYYFDGDYAKAEAVLRDLINGIDETDNIYARACAILADVADAREQKESRAYYLARSAIADTRSATREMSSLQTLGGILFDDNDIERAHNYLSIALSNAVECNAPLRMIQSAKAIPIIENAHRKQLRNSTLRTYGVIGLMGVLLILLIFTLRQLNTKVGEMNSLAEKLEDANKVKDIYISEFLNLCSVYIDKLNQFSKIVNRKLAAGKADDLYKLTKSGKFIEEQSGEFYTVFDDAFLHIYPGFVEGVNALLLPDSKITLREGERLNTDLRILAFMRLGIHESNRIAQLLNYSIHTIYAYRNKLKNRAIDRDTFEDRIMEIPSISEARQQVKSNRISDF